MRILLVCISLTGVLLAALFMQPQRLRGSSYAPPPKSILICGAHDYACDTYVLSYRPATHARRDSRGERDIDCERKTIEIVWSNDRFKNVEAVERAVLQAALWEQGIRDTDKRDVHDWLRLSDSIIASLFHDNPEFVNFVTAGY